MAGRRKSSRGAHKRGLGLSIDLAMVRIARLFFRPRAAPIWVLSSLVGFGLAAIREAFVTTAGFSLGKGVWSYDADRPFDVTLFVLAVPMTVIFAAMTVAFARVLLSPPAPRWLRVAQLAPIPFCVALGVWFWA